MQYTYLYEALHWMLISTPSLDAATKKRQYKRYLYLALERKLIACTIYILLSEEQQQCVGFDAQFTVRHFLLECGNFAQIRNNCFHVDNMTKAYILIVLWHF